ncbi:MAG: diguanylate cyclase, partial [Pseudomonadota bacterium]
MSRLIVCYFALIGALGLATPAQAAGDFAQQLDVNHVWVITATALVLLMQCGFMLLEAGNVRTKNTVNVAQKNLVDFLISSVCFGVIGFALMFGTSQFGWFGWDAELIAFGASEPWTITFFVFQLVFCGTAATIVSGAVAERMSLGGYIACTALIALIIYPVAGHWSWGNLLNTETAPFLAARGFMDFAGGTVVHAVGAAVGLAAIIQLGPRKGRFDQDGNPIKIRGHSPVLATVGTFFIWVGWIGFNGGSTTSGTGDIAQIVYVTMIGGAVGGVVGMGLGRLTDRHWVPIASINGTLAGLVGVT